MSTGKTCMVAFHLLLGHRPKFFSGTAHLCSVVLDSALSLNFTLLALSIPSVHHDPSFHRAISIAAPCALDILLCLFTSWPSYLDLFLISLGKSSLIFQLLMSLDYKFA